MFSVDGSGNTIIAGDVVVSGGDITLEGTGRIQGVDTVSAATDAANKGYVDDSITDLIGGAPGTLDTLNELAAAINDDASYASTLTTALATKLPLTGGTLSGDVTFTGATHHAMWDKSASALEFWDNAKLTFGDPGGTPDLQIYHDGSNSYIDETGTGGLYLKSSAIRLQSAGGENMIYGVADGGVYIYHNNAKKFETTSTGVAVTGASTFSGALVTTVNNGKWRVNNYGAMYFRNSSDPTHESYIHSRSNGSLSIGRVAESDWTGTGNDAYAASTYDHVTFDTSSNATFAGVLILPNGSTSAPSVANEGDTNTGMYWPSNHQVGFAVNGSRKFYMSETKTYFQNQANGVEINNGLTIVSGGVGVTGNSTFEGNIDVQGNSATIGSSSQTTTTLNLTATNTAGSPANAVEIVMTGYEGRGIGTFYKDTTYTGAEWFSGIRYGGGFSNYAIGYDATGGQAEYSANSLLTIHKTGNAIFAGNVKVKNALIDNASTTSATTTTTIANVAHATYTAAFFDFVIKNGTNVRSGVVYACHDGTDVEYTETSTHDLGDTSDVTLSVDISGANMRLRATTTSSTWTIKSLVRAI